MAAGQPEVVLDDALARGAGPPHHHRVGVGVEDLRGSITTDVDEKVRWID